MCAAQITIDDAWLAKSPGCPWALDTPEATYTLARDVRACGTAFVVAAPAVTIDLGGHTVTFDTLPAAFTEGFESGAKGWDFGPAAVADNTSYLFGKKVLRFANVSSPAVALSPPIVPPKAPYLYAAGCATGAPGGTQNSPPATVTLEVVRVSDGAVLASSVGGGWNADGPVARVWLPDRSPVRIRITAAPWSDQPATVDVDHVSLVAFGHNGILASTEWHIAGWDNLPKSLNDDYRKAGGGVTIRNGRILQGVGRSRGAAGVQALTLPGPLTVDGVTIGLSGDDTSAVVGGSNGTPGPDDARTINNCRISYSFGCDISRRAEDCAAISLSKVAGPVVVTNNTLIDFPQVGVFISGDGVNLTDPRVIRSNTFNPRTVVTNGYAIAAVAVSNLEIGGNTIATRVGRGSYGGISLDGYSPIPSENVEISNNKVDINGVPTREYGNSVPVRALRMRNNVDAMGAHRNIRVFGNEFDARTTKNGVRGAFGARVSYTNPGGKMNDAGIIFDGNTFRGVVSTTDPSFSGAGFCLDGLADGIHPLFSDNRFEGDDVALWLGGSDGDDIGEHGVTFQKCTFVRVPGSIRPFFAVRLGYWRGGVDGVRMDPPALEGGATFSVTSPAGLVLSFSLEAP